MNNLTHPCQMCSQNLVIQFAGTTELRKSELRKPSSRMTDFVTPRSFGPTFGVNNQQDLTDDVTKSQVPTHSGRPRSRGTDGPTSARGFAIECKLHSFHFFCSTVHDFAFANPTEFLLSSSINLPIAAEIAYHFSHKV